MYDEKPKFKNASMHELTLENAFQFTQDDLETNRQGLISQHQFGVIRNQALRKALPIIPALAIILFVFAVPFGFMFTSSSGPSFGNSTVVTGVSFFSFLPIILAVVAVIALGSLALPLFNLWRDQRDGRAEAAEGNVMLDIQQRIRRSSRSMLHHNNYHFGYRSSTYFLVYIEGQKFEVTEQKFLAFKNGDPYRVYYAPHSRMILAVEWLNASPFE